MAEQSWADGYVVDVGYVHGFYGELAPSSLAFAALLGRIAPPALDAPFTYYELGCGQGETSAVLAAANPQGRFTGVDFNPTHIHHARALARDAGIDNLEFLEKSFAELVALDLPDADVVALHGVWSWVSAENRAHIVEFIRRRLKPGGLALVSYNALPGMSQVAPLQRLLADHAGAGAGEVVARVGQAVDFARRAVCTARPGALLPRRRRDSMSRGERVGAGHAHGHGSRRVGRRAAGGDGRSRQPGPHREGAHGRHRRLRAVPHHRTQSGCLHSDVLAAGLRHGAARRPDTATARLAPCTPAAPA